MKCGRTGCAREGTHHLIAKVWAVGAPKSSTPITATIGIMFCKDHAREEAETKNLIGDEFWQVLASITRGRKLMPVDLDSLELVMQAG